MATEVIVDGPCIIKTEPVSGGTLTELGRSENGVEITENVMMMDVHGDDNGGDAGPPIDIQYMGEFHVIRATLTKYDEAEANKIRARIAGGTAGTPGTAGTLMFGATKDYRLLLHSTNRPRNYLRVVFREAMEVNKGTKHSKFTFVAHAYKDANGVIYNSTTTD